ncbi:MAG: D-inositol-3-phosphate glycosyltransferase [Verrucomicrobiae bacterium]|nr:D-inositol-3-phosphate glycosyltransferase [Verrucomicrobiae bacterium]
MRGFRELGVADIHIVIVSRDVQKVMVEEGPLGTVYRVPSPPLSGSPSFFLWRRQLILRELAKIKPDIVNGQGCEEEYGFTTVTAPFPNVVTFHGVMHRIHKVNPPPFFSLNHVPRWMESVVARRARHVICLSRETDDFLTEFRSPAKRHFVPNAIAPCFFEVSARRATPAAFTLLYVGTIYPLKRVHLLIEALPVIQRQANRPVKLRVVGGVGGGSADYAQRLRGRAQELGVAEQIEWLGVQSESSVAGALAQSDLLLLPSLQETAPMCIGEAMAAGVPVVATPVGGVPDMVQDGTTGRLVGADGFAEAVVSLLADSSSRAAMGEAARVYAAANYAPRVVAERTLAVFADVLRTT